ncbi:MAG: type VI secretion system tube protein Hcp [Acidimicrobiia bacterium]|nr:type VI secretion system tube protein Hcp [Acidimicrobiia bacterium]
MALEQFIDITGVQGESAVPDLKGAVPVLSWTIEVGGEPDAASEPEGAVTFGPFVFTKRVDSSTPVLLALCARKVVVAQARLVVRSPGLRDARVVVDLRDVRVSSLRASFQRGETEPTESVTLRYRRVWFGSAVVDRRAGAEDTNWFAWDVIGNAPAS